MNKRNKTYIAIISIIVVTLVIYFIYYKNNLALFRDYTIQENAKNMDQPDNNKLNDWKIYRDEKYSFEFFYPNYLGIVDNIGTNPINLGKNNYLYLGKAFLDSKGRIGFDSALNPQKSDQSNFEDIGSLTWQKDYNHGGYFAVYSTEFNGVNIGIGILDSAKEDLLKQILSTFHFIDLPYFKLNQVLESIKIGDKFKNFSVKSIKPGWRSGVITGDNAVVEFDGQVVLKGHYSTKGTMGGILVCMDNIDFQSYDLLPKLDKSYDYEEFVHTYLAEGIYTFCFPEAIFFRKSHNNAPEGNVVITINNLIEKFDYRDSSMSATLVGVDFERN